MVYKVKVCLNCIAREDSVLKDLCSFTHFKAQERAYVGLFIPMRTTVCCVVE